MVRLYGRFQCRVASDHGVGPSPMVPVAGSFSQYLEPNLHRFRCLITRLFLIAPIQLPTQCLDYRFTFSDSAI